MHYPREHTPSGALKGPRLALLHASRQLSICASPVALPACLIYDLAAVVH